MVRMFQGKRRSQTLAIVTALLAVPFVIVDSNRVHKVFQRFARRKGPAGTTRNGDSTRSDRSSGSRQTPQGADGDERLKKPSVGISVQATETSPDDQSVHMEVQDPPSIAPESAPGIPNAEHVANEGPEMQAEHVVNADPEMQIETDDASTEQQANDDSKNQALRRVKYLKFCGEDENDYTRGPIRIVDASDGVENVSSLLLNLDFSRKVQAAIQSQREVRALEKSAVGEHHRWRDLISQITMQIADLNIRILMATDEREVNDDEDTEEDLPSLRKEVHKLEGFQEAVQYQIRLVEAGIEAQKEHLHICQEKVNAYLEEAFVAAKLMESAPADIEPDFDAMDLEAEFGQYCKEMDEEFPGWDADEKPPGDAESQPAATIPDDQDPARQQKMQAQVTWQQAHLKFRKAQEAFDAREEDADQDRCRAEEANEDPLDWSLRWVQRGRELTRALIEAEEEESRARAAAEEAGVDVAQHYQKSRFQDHASDGYGSGYERGGITQAPRERIFEWMSQIPDGEAGDPNKQELVPRPEIDDWNYEDIAINESRSVIDDDPGRQKIDSWSRACGRGGR
ncbi:hypothetical protein CB0940_00203 [Cercospora beticola]|uniref:Uncharacterized protein n=1 Tax=Cercospora beticola TaxID=122368 RepID=A0A2G5I8L9_CERBT|nr:hypothetical protein CB0940_00203 [Cercospora beticola]PIB01129.1 hypothetical protein CB0940_00203 [Cercospora beticola]WPA95608.1 hypothetical protein RHO25_000210 [Cercospora beticola]